jgi:nucleoside-diphosphate-sugar epimerase
VPQNRDCTLITGASGYIGGALARSLPKDRVVCVSRKALPFDAPHVAGEFFSPDVLEKLNAFEITRVVHLAAVTGGHPEAETLDVNVLGTRRMLRHLLERGCRRFVLASSIAAVGCLHAEFLPLQLPIPDDHPCLARDAYGHSKYLMEELTRFLARTAPESEFTCFRIGAVVDDEKWTPPKITTETKVSVPFAELARVRLGDVLRAIGAALGGPPRPSFHLYNLVGPTVSCDAPTAEMLRALYGARIAKLDLSAYGENRFGALYAMTKIERELGFKPQEAVR